MTSLLAATGLQLPAAEMVTAASAQSLPSFAYLTQYQAANSTTELFDCGPASVAMALEVYGRRPSGTSAASFIKQVRAKGGRLSGNTFATDLEKAISAFGLTSAEIGESADANQSSQIAAMKRALTADHPVIAFVHGADLGRGEKYGDHWMLLRAVSADGKTFTFADPDDQHPTGKKAGQNPNWKVGGPALTLTLAEFRAALVHTQVGQPAAIEVLPGPWSPGPTIGYGPDQGAFLLPDGRVLIANSVNESNPAFMAVVDLALKTAKVYVTETPVGPTVLLPNGQALVMGSSWDGYAGHDFLSIQRFDPRTGTFTPFAEHLGYTAVESATRLSDGRILIFGADQLHAVYNNGPELFDPASGKWSVAGRMPTLASPYFVTQLQDGRVLVIGPEDPLSDPTLWVAQMYDPRSDRWSPLGRPPLPYSDGTQSVALADGRVLFTGGLSLSGKATRSAYAFDPISETWSQVAPMLEPRVGDTATLLPTGLVLVAFGDAGTTPTAEVYDPNANSWRQVARPVKSREAPVAVLLGDGRVFVAGGIDLTNWPPACNGCVYGPPPALGTSEIFTP